MAFKNFLTTQARHYTILKTDALGLDWIGNKLLESNIPSQDKPESSSTDQNLLLELINSQELVDILKVRRTAEQSHRLAFGSPDFLPFAFLQNGFRCGSAVCLLRRTLTPDEVEALVQRIERVDNYLTQTLNQLLKIEQGFWGISTSVTDALKQNPELREKLKEKIQTANPPLPIGTGFLVGRDHLLTNHHILNDASIVENFIAEFDPKVIGDSEIPPIRYQLDSSLFQTNPLLDYTLVKLKSLSEAERKEQKTTLAFRQAGNNFGWIPLTKEATAIAPPVPLLKPQPWLGFRLFWKKLFELINPQDKVEIDSLEWSRLLRNDQKFLEQLDQIDTNLKQKLKRSSLLGEPVNIVQHPRGEKKQIVIYNNRIQNLRKDFLQYETDAEPGSSGSPLFNAQWQLIGIHHSALINSKTEEVLGYLGTRACRIVEDLRNKVEQLKASGTHEPQLGELSEFLDRYVDDTHKGRIFISAGRSRKDILGEKDSEIEVEITKRLVKLVCSKINSSDDFIAVHIQNEPNFTDKGCRTVKDEELDPAICWLRDLKEEYQPGDVAIELLLDQAEPLGSKQIADATCQHLRGAKVYYIARWSDRKLDAERLLIELMLQVRKGDEKFPSQGAQPDTAVGGLKFCRSVPMPSLVLYLGYLTSDQDLKLLDDHADLFAEGIANGLKTWATALSPVQRF